MDGVDGIGDSARRSLDLFRDATDWRAALAEFRRLERSLDYYDFAALIEDVDRISVSMLNDLYLGEQTDVSAADYAALQGAVLRGTRPPMDKDQLAHFVADPINRAWGSHIEAEQTRDALERMARLDVAAAEVDRSDASGSSWLAVHLVGEEGVDDVKVLTLEPRLMQMLTEYADTDKAVRLKKDLSIRSLALVLSVVRPDVMHGRQLEVELIEGKRKVHLFGRVAGPLLLARASGADFTRRVFDMLDLCCEAVDDHLKKSFRGR